MGSPQIAVIGAGVIGLSSAVVLQKEFPNIPITIISEKFSPDTTGDGSAGLLEPYLSGDTDLQLVRKWSHATYEMLRKLWQTKEGPRVGLSLIPLTILSDKNFDKNADTLHQGLDAYSVIGDKQLARLRKEHGNNYRSGYQFVTFTCEPQKFLPYLMAEFLKRGGKIEHRKVTSLEELAEKGYSIVVNCTGLQAEELVADQDVFPIRGQMAMVEAPWQKEAVIYISDDSSAIIIPNHDFVCLGGTSQKNNRSLRPDPSDREKILTGCYKLSPGLKNAKLLKEWVGLRPGRTCVRLEMGQPITNSKGDTTLVVHNYGHGGSGVTLSWGCALEVADILRHVMPMHTQSKL